MLGFFRRKDRTPEPEGTTCHWCRVVMPATGEEELARAGAVFDPLAGWFCSKRCAKQYSIRFRVQPGRPKS